MGAWFVLAVGVIPDLENEDVVDYTCSVGLWDEVDSHFNDAMVKE